MQLSDIVSVSLTISNPPNLQTGFQTGLILGFSGRLPSGVRIAFFNNIVSPTQGLQLVAAAGFLTTDPEYLAAASYLAQTPTPTSLAIGKRKYRVAQVSTLTVTTATSGHSYSVSLYGQTVTYTAGGSDTTTTIAAALVTLLEALTPPYQQGTTIANLSNVITITGNVAGSFFSIASEDTLITLGVSAAPVGIYQDLQAITQYNLGAVNGNNFVLFTNTGENDTDIWFANMFGYTFQKIQISKSSEAGCLAGTDVLYNNIAAISGLAGTCMCYFSASNGYAQYADAALMGLLTPQNPGSFSLNLKVPTGITPDGNLTEAQIAFLRGAYINFLGTMGTQPFFINGRMADGNGIDIYYGLYAMNTEMQISVITAMAALPKFPFDDAGLTIIQDAINQVANLFSGSAYGFLSNDPATGVPYTITMPSIISFSANQRKIGALTGIVFNGHLAGDVLTAAITGQVHY